MRGQAQSVPAFSFSEDNLKPGEIASSCFIVTHLKFKDPEQPSTLPEAQRIPTRPGPRRRGEGKGQGQGRSPSLLLPGLRQQFGTTQRILPERTLLPVPCDPGSWATGLRPHSPRPRVWWTDRRRHFVAGDQHTTCVFPSHPPAAPRLDNGRKGRRCGPTSHSQRGTPVQGPRVLAPRGCVLNRLWN